MNRLELLEGPCRACGWPGQYEHDGYFYCEDCKPLPYEDWRVNYTDTMNPSRYGDRPVGGIYP